MRFFFFLLYQIYLDHIKNFALGIYKTEAHIKRLEIVIVFVWLWLGTQSCHYLNFEQDVLARAMNKSEVNFFLLEIGESLLLTF